MRETTKTGMRILWIDLLCIGQQQQAMSQYNAAVSEYLQAKTKYLILTGRRQQAW